MSLPFPYYQNIRLPNLFPKTHRLLRTLTFWEGNATAWSERLVSAWRRTHLRDLSTLPQAPAKPEPEAPVEMTDTGGEKNTFY